MTERSRRVEDDSARSEGTAKAGVQKVEIDNFLGGPGRYSDLITKSFWPFHYSEETFRAVELAFSKFYLRHFIR